MVENIKVKKAIKFWKNPFRFDEVDENNDKDYEYCIRGPKQIRLSGRNTHFINSRGFPYNYQSKDFSSPNRSWSDSNMSKVVNQGPFASGSDKQDVINISNGDDDVLEIGESKPRVIARARRRPLAQRTYTEPEDDDDIQVVKVQESTASRSRRLGNTLISSKRDQTVRHRYFIGDARSKYTTQPLSTMQDKPRSTLDEGTDINERSKYEALLQYFTKVKLTSNKSRTGIPKPSIARRCGAVPVRMFKPTVEVVDLTEGSQDSPILEIDVETSGEKKPPMTASTKDGEPVFTPINTLDKMLKIHNIVYKDWTSELLDKWERLRKDQDAAIKSHETSLSTCSSASQHLVEDTLAERLDKYATLSGAEVPEIVEEKLPELTSAMQREIENALMPRPSTEVLVRSFGLEIKRHDMHTLAGLNWLNDEIINFYMNLIIERGKMDNYPNVYAMNTFFYPKLITSGYASLKRWTRKVDIFSQDLVIAPIHMNVHWCLAVMNMKTKNITYYDSMGAPNNRCLNGNPQQQNGSDCGVFTCIYAEYLSRNAELSFSQKDMPYFRQKMVYEILKSKLLL
uniref:Ubiquitin-like protease family profile domain-containing protein n=1 Tax=Timema tahoe TaxID=61484 RepID=A0A7R9NYE7_9NEOP|nr:unnamed protein product [Timema tahoe]